MPDPNERDAKLIQHLSEALGKERELETALQVDIAITTKAPYKKRLRQHLRETKAHRKRSTARRERMPKNAKTSSLRAGGDLDLPGARGLLEKR